MSQPEPLSPVHPDRLSEQTRTDHPCGCWTVRDGWFNRVSHCEAHRPKPTPARCPNCDHDEIRQVLVNEDLYWRCVMCHDDWPVSREATR